MLANFGPMNFFSFLFLHQHSDLCFYLQSSWMNLFWHSSPLKHVNVAINKQHLIHGLLRIFVMIIIKIKYIPRFPLTRQHYHTTTALSTSSIILCLQTETSKKPVSKAIMIIVYDCSRYTSTLYHLVCLLWPVTSILYLHAFYLQKPTTIHPSIMKYTFTSGSWSRWWPA